MSPATSSRVKRLADCVAASILLTVTSPLFAITSIIIATRLGRPVFYRQERHGLNGEPFAILKFRTMTDATDRQGHPLPDSDRITPLGAWLRTTSIDELPELINVLRGDMSLVGPRPLLPRYTPYFTAAERRRFDARPGITGLAQINGRNAAAWDERLNYDIQYVDTWHTMLDVRILARTCAQVIRRDGVHVVPNTHLLDLDEERSEISDAHSTGD